MMFLLGNISCPPTIGSDAAKARDAASATTPISTAAIFLFIIAPLIFNCVRVEYGGTVELDCLGGHLSGERLAGLPTNTQVLGPQKRGPQDDIKRRRLLLLLDYRAVAFANFPPAAVQVVRRGDEGEFGGGF